MIETNVERTYAPIVAGSEISQPLAQESAIRFSISDTSGNPINPDKIWSVDLYRIARSFDSSSDAQTQTELVFLRSIFDLSGQRPIWSSEEQDTATATVDASHLATFTTQGLYLGFNHTLSNDTICLSDGTPIGVPPERMQTPTQVPGEVDTWEIVLNLWNIVRDGEEVSLLYAKSALDGGLRSVEEGVFDIVFGPESLRLLPGMYLSHLEYEKDGVRSTASIEFRIKPEPMLNMPSSLNDGACLDSMILKNFPFFYVDIEGGTSGPFGKLAGFINQFLDETMSMADSLPQSWDVLVCPVIMLEYIAWESGTKLYGTDSSYWRKQSMNITDRWKAKGTREGLRARLEDAGCALDDLSTYWQVRSRKFQTDHFILCALTQSTSDPVVPSVKTWYFPLSKDPWFFPGTQGRPGYLFTIEARGENGGTWVQIPVEKDGYSIARFEQDGSGGWSMALSPWYVGESNGVSAAISTLNDYNFADFDQIRVTYPVAPWGMTQANRDYIPESVTPETMRSGYIALHRFIDPDDWYIVIGEPGNIFSPVVRRVANGVSEELEISGDKPEPRLGATLIHYCQRVSPLPENNEDFFVLFGGKDFSGNVLGDTWILTISGWSLTWTRYSGPSPSRRSGMSMVEPQAAADERKFIVFGGMGENGALGDTWEWYEASDDQWQWREMSFNPVVGTSDNGLIVGSSSTSVNPVVGNVVTMSVGAYTGFENDTLVSFGNALSGVVFWMNITSSNPGVDVTGTITNVYGAPTGAIASWVVTYTNQETIWINVLSGSYFFHMGQEIYLRQSGSTGSLYSWIRGHIVSGSMISSTTLQISIDESNDSQASPLALITSFDILMQRSPSARCGAASTTVMTDATNKISIGFLFGGMDAQGQFLGDLWGFTYAEGWMPIFPEAPWPGVPFGPSPRACASMVRFSNGSGDFDMGATFAIYGGLDGTACDCASGLDPTHLSGRSYFLCQLWGKQSVLDIVSLLPGCWWRGLEDGRYIVNDYEWGVLWVADEYDSQHQSRDIYPMHENNQRRMSLVTLCEEDAPSGIIGEQSSTTIFTESLLDHVKPLSIGQYSLLATQNAQTIYTIDKFQGGLHIHADNKNTVTHAFPIVDPEEMAVTHHSINGKLWDITPHYLRRTIGVNLVRDAFVAERVSLYFETLPEKPLYATNDDELAFPGAVIAGTCYSFLCTLYSSNGSIAGKIAIREESGSFICTSVDGYPVTNAHVEEVLASGVVRFLVDPEDCLITRANVWYDDNLSLFWPPIGTYTFMRSGTLYLFVASDSGAVPKVTIVPRDAQEYDMAEGSFAVIFDVAIRKTRLCIVSESMPAIEAGTSVRIAFTSPVLHMGTQSVQRTKTMSFDIQGAASHLRSDGEMYYRFTIAQGAGFVDVLEGEPALVWDMPVYDITNAMFPTASQSFVELVDPSSWKTTVASGQTGSITDIPVSVIVFEKTMSRTSSSVYAWIRGDFIEPGIGSKFVIQYPLCSGSRLVNPSAVVTMPQGLGDYEHTAQMDLIGKQLKDVSAVIDPAMLRSCGHACLPADRSSISDTYGLVGTVGRTNFTIIDFERVAAGLRPFSDARLYNPFVDPSWTIAYMGEQSILWDSILYVQSRWSDGSLNGWTSTTQAPPYANVTAIEVTLPYGSDVLSMRRSLLLNFPVPTLLAGRPLGDILTEAVCQDKAPDMADSTYGLSDWVELYILSLPRLDVRNIETTYSYAVWKSQVMAGQTPVIDPSPPIDNNTRLLDKTDPMLSIACADLNPFPGTVTFGKIRTRVPYGRTIFNIDEFDGSVRDSYDPCDIDSSFTEPCGCCPASVVGYMVTVPLHLGLTPDAVRALIAEMLPAHAIVRFSGLRFESQDLVRRPVDTYEISINQKVSDAVVTWNPGRLDDGSFTPGRSLPFVRGQFTSQNTWPCTAYPVNPQYWLLEAPESILTQLPFAGEMAFCICDNNSKRLPGHVRDGEGRFIFESRWDDPVLGDSGQTDYAVYNMIGREDDASVSLLTRNVEVSFSNLDVQTSGVSPGDYVVFMTGPDNASWETGNATHVEVEILSIHSRNERTWLILDAQSTGDLGDALSDTYSGPRAFGVRKANSDWRQASTRRTVNPDFGLPVPGDVYRARNERIIELPSRPFSQEPSDYITRFVLPRPMLQNTYRVGEREAQSMPSILTTGSLVDGFGTVADHNGQKLVDFVVSGGVFSTVSYGDLDTPTCAYDSVTQIMSFSFTTNSGATPVRYANLVLSNFRYTSAENASTMVHARQLTTIMPRSGESEWDLNSTKFLFYSWDDGPQEWAPQTLIQWTIKSEWTITSPGWKGMPLAFGDHVFLEDTLWSVPYEAIEANADYDASNGMYIIRTYDDLSNFSASQRAVAGRFAVSGPVGTWTRVTDTIDIDIDLLSGPSPGSYYISNAAYRSYEAIPRVTWLTMAEHENLTIESAVVGGGPFTTRLVVHRWLTWSDLPMSLETVVIDPASVLGVDIGRRMPYGGSEVEAVLLDINGQEIERQLFG